MTLGANLPARSCIRPHVRGKSRRRGCPSACAPSLPAAAAFGGSPTSADYTAGAPCRACRSSRRRLERILSRTNITSGTPTRPARLTTSRSLRKRRKDGRPPRLHRTRRDGDGARSARALRYACARRPRLRGALAAAAEASPATPSSQAPELPAGGAGPQTHNCMRKAHLGSFDQAVGRRNQRSDGENVYERCIDYCFQFSDRNTSHTIGNARVDSSVGREEAGSLLRRPRRAASRQPMRPLMDCPHHQYAGTQRRMRAPCAQAGRDMEAAISASWSARVDNYLALFAWAGAALVSISTTPLHPWAGARTPPSPRRLPRARSALRPARPPPRSRPPS